MSAHLENSTSDILRVTVFSGTRKDMMFPSLAEALDECVGGATFVGDCPSGLDYAVRSGLSERGVEHVVCSADWNTYGKRAGPLRNQEMLNRAFALAEEQGCSVTLYAWPTVGGRGTQDCVRRMASMIKHAVKATGTVRLTTPVELSEEL